MNNTETKQRKDQSVRTNFTPELKAKIDGLAEQKGIPKTQVVTQLVEDGFRYREEPSPLLSKDAQERIAAAVIAEFESRVIKSTDSSNKDNIKAWFDRCRHVMSAERPGFGMAYILLVSIALVISLLVIINLI